MDGRTVEGALGRPPATGPTSALAGSPLNIVRKVMDTTRRAMLGAGLLVVPLVASCSSPAPTPASSSAAPATALVSRGDGSTEGLQVVDVRGDGLRFAPARLTVAPGRVRVRFTASTRTSQTFTAPSLGVDSGNVPPGHTVVVDLIAARPGDYRFYSAYQRTQGMVGTLVVRPHW
jgi:plastocyanin